MRIDRQSELSFVGQYNDNSKRSRKGKFRSRKGQNTYKIANEKLFDLSSASQTWSRIDKVFYDDQVSGFTVAPAPPHSMLVSVPPMPVKPLCQMSSSIPTSTVTAQETNGGRQNMFRREQKKENMNGTDKSGEEGLKEEKKAENTAVPVAENAAA